MTVATTMTDRAPSQCPHPSCLGLPEWTTCCQENANAATTSSEVETVAADTAVTNNERYERYSFLTADEAEKIAVRYVPKDTEKTTKWALWNFNEWREVQNRRFPNDPVPRTSADSTILCKWLSHFVAETRNRNILLLLYTNYWLVY